jgi:maleate cis-trans isomerase
MRVAHARRFYGRGKQSSHWTADIAQRRSASSLDYLGARWGAHVPAEKIFGIMEKIVHETPGADGIYFQGAPFNPLPIIDRIESELKLPVIASNPAMLWYTLSRLGRKYTIPGYGKLLASWPAFS